MFTVKYLFMVENQAKRADEYGKPLASYLLSLLFEPDQGGRVSSWTSGNFYRTILRHNPGDRLFMVTSVTSVNLNSEAVFWARNLKQRCKIYGQSKYKGTVKLALCLINQGSRCEDVWWNGIIAPPFFASALDAGELADSLPGHLTPRENTWYLLDRRICGPQNRFGHCGVEKNLFS
jgi:hypothetical protein